MESTIEFSFLLNSCLDVFEIRQKQTSVDQDLGLLHAVDERLAAYGWLTTTGMKLIIIVDLLGQPVPSKMEGPMSAMVSTLRDSDLKPVCLLSLTLSSLYTWEAPRHVYPLLRFQGMELTMAF